MDTSTAVTVRQPWNKGKLVGQKTPFKLKEIWAIRIEDSKSRVDAVILRFLTWRSTASCASAISCS